PSESAVLIRFVSIDDIERAFRDSPGDSSLLAVADLSSNGPPATLIKKRLRITPHDEEWHQVFENRRAPRQQRGNSLDAGEWSAKSEPMRFRYVALCDGDEACEARLGGEQIVVRRVETAEAFSVRRAIADRQQPALTVVKQLE